MVAISAGVFTPFRGSRGARVAGVITSAMCVSPCVGAAAAAGPQYRRRHLQLICANAGAAVGERWTAASRLGWPSHSHATGKKGLQSSRLTEWRTLSCRRHRSRTRGTASRGRGRRANRRATGIRRTSASAPRACRPASSTRPRPASIRSAGSGSCDRARARARRGAPPIASAPHHGDRRRRRVGRRPRSGEHALVGRRLVLALPLHDVDAAVAVEIGERDAERARRRRAVEDIEPRPSGGPCRR